MYVYPPYSGIIVLSDSKKRNRGKKLRIHMNSEILNRLNIMHVFHDLRKFYLIFQKKKKTLVER